VCDASQRRVHQPYGLEGGESGERGRNIWIKQPREEDGDKIEGEEASPRIINIGGKASVFMGKGDRIVIHTPGGGGWGSKEGQSHERDGVSTANKIDWAARGSLAEREALQAAF
jgi:5-oxoprolinase (ATP-hydrolysing)